MKNLLLITSSLLITGNLLLAQDFRCSKKFVERYQQAKEENFIDIHNHIINIRKWL